MIVKGDIYLCRVHNSNRASIYIYNDMVIQNFKVN